MTVISQVRAEYYGISKYIHIAELATANGGFSVESDAASDRVVYVAAHGMDPRGVKTFVPEGVTVVFFARPGTSLSALVGMRVLELVHDKGEEEFTGTADGKVKVPNYILSPLSDLDIAVSVKIAKVEAEIPKVESPLCFVGGKFLPAPSRLCTDPRTCRPPHHHCAGIFGLLDEFNVIRISCCRPRPQEIRSDSRVTRELVADPDPKSNYNARRTVSKFEKLIRGAEKGTVTADEMNLVTASIEFGKLSPKDQARTVGESRLVETWFEIQCARDQHEREGDWGLYVYYMASDNKVKERIVKNGALKAVLADCHKKAAALADTTDCHKWFSLLDPLDQRWITKLSPEVERWTKPMFAHNSIREARVYALWNQGLPITAFAALRGLTQNDQIIKAYADSEPATIQVCTVGKDILRRWNDPGTTDTDRQASWDAWPAEEREALVQLAPEAVAAWQMRQYLHGASGAFPSPSTLTSYLWLLCQEEDVQEAAATHPDWIDLIDNTLEILDRWANQATTDADRLTEWQTWAEHEREALTQLAPDAVNAWKTRIGIP